MPKASRGGGLSSQLMRLPLAQFQGLDGIWQALFNLLGAFGSDAADICWSRRYGKHKGQREQREAQSGDSRREEHVVHVFHVEAKEVERHMFHGLDVMERGEGEQEEKCRQRREDS